MDSWNDCAAYVECAECGHPIENHDCNGCNECGGECTCTEPFTQADIARLRKADGLPARIPKHIFG